jgi:hypothetical protein
VPFLKKKRQRRIQEMGGLAWFQRNHTFPFPLAWFQRNHTFPLPSLSLGVGSGEEGSRRWYASRAFFESKRSERAFFESKRSERAFKESKRASEKRGIDAGDGTLREKMDPGDGSKRGPGDGRLGLVSKKPHLSLSLGVPFPWLGFKETTPCPLAFLSLGLVSKKPHLGLLSLLSLLSKKALKALKAQLGLLSKKAQLCFL